MSKMSEHRIRIGHLSTVYHTAFILMGTDLLSARNIRAEWELFPSGPDIIRAMEQGMIDLAYIGLPPFIIGLDRGLEAVCVAGGHIEGTMMIAGSGIRPHRAFPGMQQFLIQFSGKSIGSPPSGSIHDIIIRDLLSRYGIDSVTVRNYAWADFLHDALDDGDIVAAVGTPALAVAAHRFGSATIVLPPDQVWPFNPSYGIVAARSLLARRNVVIALIEAHEEASEMIRLHPGRCSRIVADQTGFVDEAYMKEAYQISPHYCSDLPQEYIRSTEAFSQTLHHLGKISRPVPKEEIFDTSFVRVIHPGPHHYRDGISFASECD
jgi:NitT/TauT family transport system substrate-binding protein